MDPNSIKNKFLSRKKSTLAFEHTHVTTNKFPGASHTTSVSLSSWVVVIVLHVFLLLYVYRKDKKFPRENECRGDQHRVRWRAIRNYAPTHITTTTFFWAFKFHAKRKHFFILIMSAANSCIHITIYHAIMSKDSVDNGGKCIDNIVSYIYIHA